MYKTIYLKREKNGVVIQLFKIVEKDILDVTPKITRYDIDDNFRHKFYFLDFTVPQDELHKIDEEEFFALFSKHLCHTPEETPVPQMAQSS